MTSLSRRRFLGGAIAASTAAVAAGGERAPRTKPKGARRPNFLVLVTDDHRYDTIGCMGNAVIRTPHLDALAREGVVFENNFCTTSICCTSRASILTGLYARRHGIHDFSSDLPPTLLARTYPALLREAGYRTGFVGKYGIGHNLPKDSYDFWRGFPGQGKYFNEVDGKVVHMTDMICGDALEFLEGFEADHPFCLSVSFKAPHTMDYDPRPWQPAPRFEVLYRDAAIPVPETATEAAYRALPEFLKDSEGRRRWQNRFRTPERYQETMRDYYRLLTGVDEAIGRMREALQQRGLDDDTVIVYTGDNGFYLGERGLAGKWYAHEESMRTPLIVRNPHLPKRRRGRRLAPMALNIDLAPTIVDVAGLPVPENMQGRSLVPLMRGRERPWREDWFYEHPFDHPRIPRSEGVRTERWKYIRWVDAEPALEELYDLQEDPLEQHNLAGDPQHAAQLEALRARWRHYRSTLGPGGATNPEG